MFRNFLCAGTYSLMLLVASPGLAVDGIISEPEARAELRTLLASIETYHGRFEQTIKDETGQLVEQGAGEVWLQRPGRFRWQYLTPWPRLIVADSDKVWLFDQELDQVTVRSIDAAMENTPAALLVGDDSILDRYELSASRFDGDSVILNLQPVEATGDFLNISLTQVDGRLSALALQDRFGQTTVINFVAIATEVAFEEALFQLEIPEGVDVIDETDGAVN